MLQNSHSDFDKIKLLSGKKFLEENTTSTVLQTLQPMARVALALSVVICVQPVPSYLYIIASSTVENVYGVQAVALQTCTVAEVLLNT